MADAPTSDPIINISMSASRLQNLVERAWHDSAAATATRATEAIKAASARYLKSSGWTHIFSENGREIERETRWVYDRETKNLAILDIKRNHKWREASDEEKADLLDSLINGNPGCLDNPEDWNFEMSSTLTNWE